MLNQPKLGFKETISYPYPSEFDGLTLIKAVNFINLTKMEIEANNQNEKVLSELIAGKIERELKRKENKAQDLLDSINNKIIYKL